MKPLRSLLSATWPSDAMAMRAARHDLGDGACFNIECTSKNSKQPRTKLTSSSHAHAGSFYQESSSNAVACPWLCSTRDTKQPAIKNTLKQKCQIEIFSNSVPLRQQSQRYTTALGTTFGKMTAHVCAKRKLVSSRVGRLLYRG